MATEYDPNNAHPKIPFKGTYPNLWVTQRADGSQEIRSLEPGQESFFVVQPTGNYTGHGPDGAEIKVTVGKQHSYNADGTSQTTDGHTDTKISGSNRSSIAGSDHSETAGNKYSGGGGVCVVGTKGSQITHSDGDVFHVSEGNIVTDHTGSVNHNYTGDFVDQVNGNKVNMIKGEYGVNISEGNYDMQIDAGKARMWASDDILIESTSKITLKVGGSTIVIEPSVITIKSAKVDINPT
jgi:type VI secretion system secreted protein VgrG